MGRRCSVCDHPERKAIDKALLPGAPANLKFRDVAERHRLSLAALVRHRDDHLPATMVKAQEQEDVRHAIDVVQQLKAINGAAIEVLRRAREAGDGELVLKATDRVLRQCELQAKLLGELDERPQVNVLVAPEWLTLRAALLQALLPYAEARVAVAGALARLGGEAS